MKVNWTPSTIGALIVIVGGLALRFCGIDSEVWSLVLIAAGFLFGEQYVRTDIKKKMVEHKIEEEDAKK